MTLFFYATLPEIKRITEEDREVFRSLSWNPQELIDLKLMERHQLLGLMMFCDIRTFNEMPIIACEDDELRTAYLIWRGALSKERRAEIFKTAEKLKKLTNATYDGLIWWLENML